jgi:hypothetical protein
LSVVARLSDLKLQRAAADRCDITADGPEALTAANQ